MAPPAEGEGDRGDRGEGGADPPRLEGLLGEGPGEVSRRLGPPNARREAGGDRWLVYRLTEGRLRVRCVDAGTEAEGRVASWTFTWRRGFPRLRQALEPLGLWPEGAPDVAARGLDPPLARRPLSRGDGRAAHSLTATAEDGRFVRIAAFDEPPDWG